MLLTITATRPPATDLGYLLHKHPGRFQTFNLTFGRAMVFYPEAGDGRCSACLLLDVDAVGLARGDGPGDDQYVSDRPYVASSFLSVAIAQVYGSALNGRCRDKPELAATPMPLEARIDVLPVRGGEPFLRRAFEPLGYEVAAEGHPLDENFPEWGRSLYFSVTLRKSATVAELLGHLYVLVPVFDLRKHYYIGDDEVEKLLRHGEAWLAGHPEREAVARRYLARKAGLYRQAIRRLVPEEPEAADGPAATEADPPGLHRERLEAVAAALKASGAARVLDLGCGEGRLIRELIKDRAFTEVVGLDVSARSLEVARERLRLDRLPEGRVRLLHGSLTYRDRRLEGFDAAAVVEVVEHLDPPRLGAFEQALFRFARPRVVALTTPNREYNAVWEGVGPGRLRHPDHRFEWTRAEFRAWAVGVADRHGYAARFLPVGPEHEALGPPTQMAVFERA